MRALLLFSLNVIAVLILSFLASRLARHFGDTVFLSERLQETQILYTIAHIANPFDTSIGDRLLAVDTQLFDRTNPTDEEARTIPRDAQVISPTQVLGVTSCIPVLMYHYIRINPWPTDTVGFGLSTPPQAFAKQLDYFKSKGYQTISLLDLKNQIEIHKAVDAKLKNPLVKLPKAKLLPPKPLIITLDDGYEDAYTAAFPLLKERGMKAVDFVITGFVGLPNYLKWPQIEELDKTGFIEIQSHTVHHYALGGTYWNDTTVMNELRQSKNALESHLGKVVDWLAYPYGSVTDHVASETAMVYYGAFGTNFGSYQSTEEQFTLPRIRVSGGDWGPSIDQRIHQAEQDAKCVH